MKYNVDYFIEKFEAIPTEEIGKASIRNHCALWHCLTEEEKMKRGITYPHNDEGLALLVLFGGTNKGSTSKFQPVWNINDGIVREWGETPKERILNKLKSLK